MRSGKSFIGMACFVLFFLFIGWCGWNGLNYFEGTPNPFEALCVGEQSFESLYENHFSELAAYGGVYVALTLICAFLVLVPKPGDKLKGILFVLAIPSAMTLAKYLADGVCPPAFNLCEYFAPVVLGIVLGIPTRKLVYTRKSRSV